MANWWPALTEIKLADAPYNHYFFEVIETSLFYSRAIADVATHYFFFSNYKQILTKST